MFKSKTPNNILKDDKMVDRIRVIGVGLLSYSCLLFWPKKLFKVCDYWRNSERYQENFSEVADTHLNRSDNHI